MTSLVFVELQRAFLMQRRRSGGNLSTQLNFVASWGSELTRRTHPKVRLLCSGVHTYGKPSVNASFPKLSAARIHDPKTTPISEPARPQQPLRDKYANKASGDEVYAGPPGM